MYFNKYILLSITILLPLFCNATNYKEVACLSNKQILELGESMQSKENADSALFYYTILNNRYSDHIADTDKRIIAQSMSNAGLLLYFKSNYSTAMEVLLKGLQISESNGFEDVICELYKNIGNIYSSFADFERSCSFYEKSYTLAKKLGNKGIQNQVLSNLVGAYCFRNDIATAKKYYSLLIRNKENSVRYRYDTMLLECLLLSSQHRTKEAIKGYLAVREFVADNDMNIRSFGTVNSCLGQLYEQENRMDSALYYYRLNEIASRKAKQMDLLAETLKSIAQVYNRKGDRSRSLAYKSEYLDLQDSIFNQQIFNGLRNAQFNYEVGKSSAVINDLREEQRDNELKITMQRRMLIIVTVGCCAVIALLLTVYWQKRRLNRAYNDLYDRSNKMIEKENCQKQQEPQTDPKISKISDIQRTKLLADISDVLDNSSEIFDSEFSIDRLAQLIGSNTRYVSEVINDEYGKNFRTLISEYRIKEAMRRLADKDNYGHLTIRAIAESVGYKSQANFIAVFTKQTGIKPSIYQKISQERKSDKSQQAE